MPFPDCIREYVPLAAYTTFGIGGPARWFAEPGDREQLRRVMQFAVEQDLPVALLGGGSNILVADSGVDAVVIRLSSKGEFGRLEQDATDPLVWRVGAAVALQSLVGETARQGIAGVEWLAGIPGVVGGAVCMNCGSADSGIGQWVSQADICMENGDCVRRGTDELCFSYRSSTIRGLAAMDFLFHFSTREEPGAVLARMRECREVKKASQPLSAPSCGCIFKNPPGNSAGMLIDAAGMKGRRHGGAEVSGIHANFIINQGSASCHDVLSLARTVRDTVRAHSGIELEPEVVLWGGDATVKSILKSS